MQQQLPGNTSSLDLWQLKLVLAFYERLGKATKGATASKGSSDALLISDEFLTGIRCGVENTLTTWQNGSYYREYTSTVEAKNCQQEYRFDRIILKKLKIKVLYEIINPSKMTKH